MERMPRAAGRVRRVPAAEGAADVREVVEPPAERDVGVDNPRYDRQLRYLPIRGPCAARRRQTGLVRGRRNHRSSNPESGAVSQGWSQRLDQLLVTRLTGSMRYAPSPDALARIRRAVSDRLNIAKCDSHKSRSLRATLEDTPDDIADTYERALAIRERVLGPDHPDTAQGLNNLASG